MTFGGAEAFSVKRASNPSPARIGVTAIKCLQIGHRSTLKPSSATEVNCLPLTLTFTMLKTSSSLFVCRYCISAHKIMAGFA
ncbi:hypothetical protein EVAR_102196_1 [Eumeta japonica]|uniref:Uncharacterized protein n=1 Tax=Eumeta variegata TaxID=151549 RepID=A0A4C1WDW9_EUMVA|nr:hypothetical protein EVAR_102196_1 [Eumeta japonica]